jgi:F-type H+-transporting ATPase subunit b
MRLWASLLSIVCTAAVALAAVGVSPHALAADPPDTGYVGSEDAHVVDPSHDDHEHDDHAGPSPFDIFESDFMPYLWNTLMFLLLLGVLMFFVWPAVLKGLRDREQKIRTDIQQAQNAREDAEKMKADFEKQLAESRAESARTIAEARATAEALKADLKASAQQEAADLKQRAQAEIASAKQAAIADIYAQTATLATEVASKILGRSITPEDHRDLVEQTVEKYQAHHI